MARREIPEHWRRAMDAKGIPSIRRLAERAGLSHPPVTNIVFGDGLNAQPETLERIAKALEIPLEEVYSMAKHPVKYVEIWDPPAEANLLTLRQRKAIDELIRSMAEINQEIDFEKPRRRNERYDRWADG